MPFLDLSCSGQKIVTLNGIDLVTGTTLEEPGMSGQIDPDQSRVDPEGWAVLAFVAGIAGLVLSFARSAILPAICAAAGFLATLFLKLKIDNDIATEAEGIVQVEYKIGYWLVLLGFLGAAALNAFLSSQREQDSG